MKTRLGTRTSQKTLEGETKWHPNTKVHSASNSQFSTFGVPNGALKVPNWLLEAERTFVFRCHLVSPSRFFGRSLYLDMFSTSVYDFFVSFLDYLGFFKSNYLEYKYLKINLNKVQIIHNFVVIQSSLLFPWMHPYFKY